MLRPVRLLVTEDLTEVGVITTHTLVGDLRVNVCLCRVNVPLELLTQLVLGQGFHVFHLQVHRWVQFIRYISGIARLRPESLDTEYAVT